jgi:RNA polymerase sigma-32 factor
MHALATHDVSLRYRRAANEAPVLDATTEQRLVAAFQSGSERALGELLRSHLRLVLSVAKRYAGHGASLEDLVSEGNLGLIEAARRFELERGNRFGTYAAWWVRAYIRRFALVNRRIVAAPSTRNARRVLSKLRETQRDIAQREGRPADRAEVARALEVTEADVAMVETALSGRDVALGPVDDGPGWEVASEGVSPEAETAEREHESFCRTRIAEALLELSPRERRIVVERYLDSEGATLSTLGTRLGLSRERVRQIEKRAQKKLRTALLDCVA